VVSKHCPDRRGLCAGPGPGRRAPRAAAAKLRLSPLV